MKLPEPGQLVGVFVHRDRRLLHSRVEDVIDDGTVFISPPTENGLPFQLSVGEEISLEWPNRRGLIEGRGTVVGRRHAEMPMLEVLLSQTFVRQRREFVRAEVVLDVTVKSAAGEEIRAATLDVSGSGVRLRVDCPELNDDEVVDLVLDLPDIGPVFARAVLVRYTAEDECAFRFVEMDPQVRERLVTFAFKAHAGGAAAVRGA